jgi:hypothetical protein
LQTGIDDERGGERKEISRMKYVYWTKNNVAA